MPSRNGRGSLTNRVDSRLIMTTSSRRCEAPSTPSPRPHQDQVHFSPPRVLDLEASLLKSAVSCARPASRPRTRAHAPLRSANTLPTRPWRRACRGGTTQQRIYLRCGCVSGARARALTGGAALSKCVYAAGRRREGRKLGTAVLPQGKRRLYAAGYDPDCFRIPCDSPTVLRLPERADAIDAVGPTPSTR